MFSSMVLFTLKVYSTQIFHLCITNMILTDPQQGLKKIWHEKAYDLLSRVQNFDTMC